MEKCDFLNKQHGDFIMTAIIGAIAFSIVIVLSILIICGLPLGELTMGGQYKIFPKNLRILLVSQLCC